MQQGYPPPATHAAKGVQGRRLADSGPDPGQEDAVVEEDNPGILCRYCRNGITSPARRISLQGGHQHTFANPAGVVFQIGCFSAASGCVSAGKPTGEFSWFPGYSWCYALCAACRAHLGWHYRSTAEEGFYGLILNRLIESERGH